MDLAKFEDRPFTYRDVGATEGPLPERYHRVDASRIVGTGSAVFDTASDRILTWEMHRRAGLRVFSNTARAETGSVVLLRIGPVTAPCRVVRVVDEPRRRGFAYGTLAGHPESGEESFVVDIDENDTVTVHIVAFSRPANRLVALTGPVNRAIQQHITNRYLGAL